ncbi:PadR family transcriptional regulator [Trebonia kvetii]|uniref:PadR family transcriptional regulator n=1 Tax=Trebonia kvetii TaxID=2480626 RepID=A0A6P2BYT6_9ACTN|nr:helix-turn-helix transcriptional regulator [Trebonia kvetii]TVZ04090.1 PadR family transcriptional regulator [Trebonia kvetii]
MTPVFRHGRLRLYLLRLLDEEPRHGYEVIRLLRDRFMGIYAPSPGTIYPRLARLEEEGLVTHDEENGRKVYRITEAGREELRNRGDELDELEEELSASVSDIVREVREDVRDTVRSLREELTRAAREMRGFERDAREQAREQGRQGRDHAREAAEAAKEHTARDTAREAAEAVKEQARQARDQAHEQREQAREQGRQARDEAFAHAHRLRDEATRLRDGARDQWNGGWGNWSEWSHWGDWAGRSGWPGQHDLGALRDFERLARDFVADLRGAARDSGSLLGSDVIPTLRDILADTLDRIRTEVFEPHHDAPGAPGAPGSSAAPGEAAKQPPKDTPAE